MGIGEKWEFKTIDELHVAANIVLKTAMMNERRKRWNKVVESYIRLLWLIERKHFPKDYEPPSNYSMLLYELYYHLGVALQKTGNHNKAIKQLTLAIDTVSVAKNGCQAGCVNNSCLMTPLYARRAFAYTKIGNFAAATKDAEKSVVLDSQNPDVYCIRGLVYSSKNEDKHAMKDLDTALTINPNHLCALVVRGALAKPVLNDALDDDEVEGLNWHLLKSSLLEGENDSYTNDDLRKAGKLNPDSKPFHSITTFHHPAILDFYDRFLYSLSVPHTITIIDLKPDKPLQKTIEKQLQQFRQPSDMSRPGSAMSSVTPIRAGTPTPAEYNRMSTRRRYDYGEAIRKHVSRPRTASEFFAQLDRERKKKMETNERPNTTRSMSTPNLNATSRSDMSESYTARTSQERTGLNTMAKKSFRPKTFEFPAATKYTIPVFQTINLQNAPRIYYKPWKGDKLPVADMARRQFSPAFY